MSFQPRRIIGGLVQHDIADAENSRLAKRFHLLCYGLEFDLRKSSVIEIIVRNTCLVGYRIMTQRFAISLKGRKMDSIITELLDIFEHFRPSIYLAETSWNDCDHSDTVLVDDLIIQLTNLEVWLHVNVWRLTILFDYLINFILILNLNEKATTLVERYSEFYHILICGFVLLDCLKILVVKLWAFPVKHIHIGG